MKPRIQRVKFVFATSFGTAEVHFLAKKKYDLSQNSEKQFNWEIIICAEQYGDDEFYLCHTNSSPNQTNALRMVEKLLATSKYNSYRWGEHVVRAASHDHARVLLQREVNNEIKISQIQKTS